jgi:hypothetical protein
MAAEILLLPTHCTSQDAGGCRDHDKKHGREMQEIHGKDSKIMLMRCLRGVTVSVSVSVSLAHDDHDPREEMFKVWAVRGDRP